MAFCKFCGKEIPEGSACDCGGAQTTPAVTAEEINQPATNNQTKGMIVIAGGALLLIIILVMLISSLSGGYKTPVKDFEKALNKGDGEKFMETMLTDDMIDEVGKDGLELMDNLIGYITESAKEQYGDNAKFSIKIKDKEKIDKDDLKELETLYSSAYDSDIEISKGYELEVELTVKGKEGKNSDETELDVIKIKGEGWKLSPDSMDAIS